METKQNTAHFQKRILQKQLYAPDQSSGITAWSDSLHLNLNSQLLYLKDSEGKGMAQVVMRGEQHFAVVTIEIHAGQQVQLGVHPVKSSVGQVWEHAGKGGERERTKSRGGRGEGEWREREVTQSETAQGEGYMDVMAQ